MKKLTIILILFKGLSYSLYAQDSARVYKTFGLQNEKQTVTNTAFQQLSNMVYDHQKHLGAACKAELNFEKATKIPLMFRVGSIEQSNYLEQKPNSNLYNK